MIINVPGVGLGDNWYTINKLLHTGEVEHLSVLTRPESARSSNVGGRLKEILSLIDGPVERIQLSNRKPTNWREGFHNLPWSTPYYPTHKIWNQNDSKIVCYQFDGRFQRKQNGLPKRRILERAFQRLHNQGFRMVHVGEPLSLALVVEYLATSHCFIGTSSGVSHVAHSVGVPMGLVLGQTDFLDYHQGKDFSTMRTVGEIVDFVNSCV